MGGFTGRLAGWCVALSLAACVVAPAQASAASPPPPGTGSGPNYCAKYGSYNSPYSLDNVYACATTASSGPTDFDNNGTNSFQCVELSARFLWAVYSLYPTNIPDGAHLVSVTHSEYPSVPVGYPGPGSVPQVGDVISLGPGYFTDPVSGHTAVVVSSNPGTGAFTIMSQNFGPPPYYPDGVAGEQNLQVDLGGGHDGRVTLSGSGSWAPASWLELASPPKTLHSAVALIPGGGGAGYSLDGYGGVHAFGGAPAVRTTGSWPGWDIARAIAVAPGSSKASVTGYVLDGFGAVHPFAGGSAGMPPAWRDGPYWPNWDIARGLVLSTPTSGYVLDGFGGVHPFAAGSTADPVGVSVSGYWANWDIARGLVLSTPTSGYVLDGFGGIHPFAGGGAGRPAAPDGRAAYWPGFDIARSIALATPTTGYVLDGYGGIHPFAPAGTNLPTVSGSLPNWPGWDVFDGVAFDPASGAGADVNIAYLDGSGDTVSSFRGPVTQTPAPPGGSTGTGSTTGVSGAAPVPGGLTVATGTRATLTIRMSKRGRVTTAIMQRKHGRLVRHHCRTAAKGGRRCTVWVTRATRTVEAARGVDHIALPVRGLGPGHYTVRVTEHIGKKVKKFSVKLVITQRAGAQVR